MRKKLSILLVVVGLLLIGAGGWEIYSKGLGSEDGEKVPTSAATQAAEKKPDSEADIEKQQVEEAVEQEKQVEERSKEPSSEEQKQAVQPAKETTTARNGESSGGSSPALAPKKPVPQATATISITGDRGSPILPATRVEVKQGDTVYDLLFRVTSQYGIQMEKRGAGAMLYVEGINNLYEFDGGPESGWMYRVNGVFPNKSAGVFAVKSGDRIEWLYTRDLGRDIGATFP